MFFSKWPPLRVSFNLISLFWCILGNILCIMEGSCAGSSQTPALADHTWPTPSCPPPSLLSQMTMLTTRLCLLPAHLWWASTSPSLVLMQGPCKPEWSVPSLQMSVKDRCPWGRHTGWPVRGGGAWSDLMFSQRYSVIMDAVWYFTRISLVVFISWSDHAGETFTYFFQQQLGLCQSPRGRRPPTRSVAVQKEVCTFGPDGRTKTVMLVDAAQQTGKKSDTIIESILFIFLLKAF